MTRLKKTKTGGRKKGTPNKVTESTRSWINRLMEDNRGQIEEDLKALEPKERLQILERFMQYTLPKMQSVQAKIDLNDLTEQQLDVIINEITQDLE